ncbi:adenylyltransferase/cytidyltransferase family protein, partial [Burkholderia sp. Ac-20349]|uniref:adenylyltransferase/cytidyltransferase family protein n=1 Tax=Burkholderia sp. Ac-20349 TaxID=2703893 RepID=UPI00197B4E3A
MSATFERKLITRDALVALRATLPSPVVFTNGVFDILHRGHVTYLADAKALGACLIVGVNSDASVRMLGKGDDRPINREDDRAALLAALESVDWVVKFEEKTPVSLIERYRRLTEGVFAVLDSHLARHPYLAGDDYSIADIAHFGWTH